MRLWKALKVCITQLIILQIGKKLLIISIYVLDGFDKAKKSSHATVPLKCFLKDTIQRCQQYL
jgi:hypothetical protein